MTTKTATSAFMRAPPQGAPQVPPAAPNVEAGDVALDLIKDKGFVVMIAGAMVVGLSEAYVGRAAAFAVAAALAVPTYLAVRRRPALAPLAILVIEGLHLLFYSRVFGVKLPPQFITGLTYAMATFGAVGVWVLGTRRSTYKRLRRMLSLSPLLVAMGCYCIAFGLSCLAADAPGAVVGELSRLVQFVIVGLLTAAALRTRSDLLGFFGAAAFILAFKLVAVLPQLGRTAHIAGLGLLAEFIPLVLFPAWRHFRLNRAKLSGTSWLALTGMASLATTLTQSRRVVVAAAIQWLIFASRLRMRGLVGVVGLVAVGYASFSYVPETTVIRMQRTAAVAEQVAETGFRALDTRDGRVATNEREKLWPTYYLMFKENPILGVGPMVSVEEVPHVARRLGFSLGKYRAHNMVLQAAADMGAVGLAALIFLYLVWATTLRRALRYLTLVRDSAMYWMTYGMWVCMLSAVLVSFVGRWGPYAKIDWIYYGFALSALAYAHDAYQAQRRATGSST